jgi:predicted amino acid racemase
MLPEATLTVDLEAIAANARTIVKALPGISVTGVTKVTCGSPEVARAMLAGGVSALGESRLENVQRLRDAGIDAPIWLLRSPTAGLAELTVRLTDMSLESEIATVAALNEAAEWDGVKHAIIAMVDLGDLREGMMPEALPAFLEQAEQYDNIEVAGIGTSLTCYGAIIPTSENMAQLASLAEDSWVQLGRRPLVSGGMSSSIEFAAAGHLPDEIDNLRIGESIVLGVSSSTRERILGLRTDALKLAVPVIECLRKPSLPIGISAQDAFGGRPVFEDRGNRLRAVCALGRQDATPDGLVPVDPRVQVLGASSDHLILDVEDLPNPPALGSPIEFVPSYAATLSLFTSPYVHKRYVGA